MLRAMKRGERAAIPIALAVLALVALLDLLTPPQVNFDVFYVIPAVVLAWAFGWRTGVASAVLVAASEVIVDSGVLRGGVAESVSLLTVIWNALSTCVAFSVLALVTNRVYEERERWRSVSDERGRLLRILEQEFPRPLSGMDWFLRAVEDGVARETRLSDKLHEQFNGLRHHSRAVAFLATDLIRIGRLRSGDLVFAQEAVDLKRIVGEAANETMDRNRVLVSAAEEELFVRGDPESLRHAISALIGRLLDKMPLELVRIFVRGSGDGAVVEFTRRGGALATDEFEFAELLLAANGGRLVVVPQAGGRGVRLNVYLGRAEKPAGEPVAAPQLSGPSREF